MKTYYVSGIKWDCDEYDPQECGCPNETYVNAEDVENAIEVLSEEYGYCIESVNLIIESDPKKMVEKKTHELLENAMDLAKAKIGRALNCGALNIEQADSDDYRLPKIILHAVMQCLVDETRPLDKDNRKESNNLYHFL